MNRLLLLLVPVLAFAAAPARAALIELSFAGTVSTQQGTSYLPGQTINGELNYDPGSNTITAFTIGAYSVQPQYASSAYISIDQYSAIYMAQTSPVAQGTSTNQTFALDLEAITTFPYTGNPTSDAVALLTNRSQIPANLDPAASNFSFYIANADGTNIQSLNATLLPNSVELPEPASLPILLTGLLVSLGVLRRRFK